MLNGCICLLLQARSEPNTTGWLDCWGPADASTNPPPHPQPLLQSLSAPFHCPPLSRSPGRLSALCLSLACREGAVQSLAPSPPPTICSFFLALSCLHGNRQNRGNSQGKAGGYLLGIPSSVSVVCMRRVSCSNQTRMCDARTARNQGHTVSSVIDLLSSAVGVAHFPSRY